MVKNNDKKLLHKYIEQNNLQRFMKLNLEDISELITFEKNEFLIHSGVASDYLYFVVSGRMICFSYTTNGKIECIAFQQGPSIIGEGCSLWNLEPSLSIKALSQCVCIAVNLHQYRNKLITDILFLQKICQILALRSNNAARCYTSSMESFEVRLAKFISKYSVNNIFAIQLTECADILNTSYRHLLRMLKLFCNLEILERQKNCYKIINTEMLNKIASGTTLIS